MKNTFFAILASAAVVFASPLPEAEADALAGMPTVPYDSQGGYPPQGHYPPQGNYPPQGHYPPQGNYPPPGGFYPPGGDPPPAHYDDGYPYPPPLAPGGGPGGPGFFQGQSQSQFQSQSQWQGYVQQNGYAPPSYFGYGGWPEAGHFPDGSIFNNGGFNGGINSVGNTCSNTQQAVSCCSGGDSSGLLGGILPSTCTLDLLSPACNQKVACCDTQTQQGVINIGFQCGGILG